MAVAWTVAASSASLCPTGQEADAAVTLVNIVTTIVVAKARDFMWAAP